MQTGFSDQDKFYMQRALDLAEMAEGRTSPNPMVGCLIVKDGLIIGEGYHQKAGTPHAEVHALTAAGKRASGADVYVTLEPCSHFGRTPPCCDALIQAGVKRVFVALVDPNPLVRGKGIQKMRAAGIEVFTGLLENEAAKLNEPFVKAMKTNLPFVLYKSASTADGKTASCTGDSRWITNDLSRKYVHELRNSYDVIMVGSKTILQDNPQLTCRIAGGRHPVRLIVDGTLSIPEEARLLSLSEGSTIIATTRAASPKKIDKLKKIRNNIEVWVYSEERYVPLKTLMQDILEKGYQSVLLEGGGTLAGQMIAEKLVDKVNLFIAPKIIGQSSFSPISGFCINSMADAVMIREMEMKEFAGDILLSGYLKQ
ncbi:bifunctional diaminohydroxyphosphoribosylaminopyrimidine deaminase/5-amino-6-(5-phosphoribosylamino)uracil reductase RibD [Syntrophobotulus glycolicus]|nr:bifunctional diaminohydroxyphosphoribosylaminopyrimidine deaminase/5-amino-6-(5-phosphoribosylamino)uracil reductase RibD [Syntrophobotulus glycolicus]